MLQDGFFIAGLDQFHSRLPVFPSRNFTCAHDRARKKMGPQNQIARPIETQLETLLFALYYLNISYNLHF